MFFARMAEYFQALLQIGYGSSVYGSSAVPQKMPQLLRQNPSKEAGFSIVDSGNFRMSWGVPFCGAERGNKVLKTHRSSQLGPSSLGLNAYKLIAEVVQWPKRQRITDRYIIGAMLQKLSRQSRFMGLLGIIGGMLPGMFRLDSCTAHAAMRLGLVLQLVSNLVGILAVCSFASLQLHLDVRQGRLLLPKNVSGSPSDVHALMLSEGLTSTGWDKTFLEIFQVAARLCVQASTAGCLGLLNTDLRLGCISKALFESKLRAAYLAKDAPFTLRRYRSLLTFQSLQEQARVNFLRDHLQRARLRHGGQSFSGTRVFECLACAP